MYRTFVLAILCMACNSHGNRSQQTVSGSLIPFLKEEVNPLLQNQETTAAKKKLDSILPFIKKRDNYVEVCGWLRCMTVVHQLEKRPDSARYYVNQALQLAIAKDTTERQILAGKIQTAAVLKDANSLDSALHYAREAYSLAHKIDTPGLPFICLKLYDIYEKIGDLEMQKKYLFEGFHRSTSPKHKTVFATNISAYYDRVNQVDSALKFFQALMKDSSFSNPYYDAVRHENLGSLLSKKGFLKEGLRHQLKGMQISRELGELTAQSYFNIAATYRKLGEYQKDAQLLDTAANLANREKDWALNKQIWRAKAENCLLRRKPGRAYVALDAALEYYKKEVDSSIIGRSRELEAKYGLLEKDHQIITLALRNQASEQTGKLQRTVIVSIISVAVMLGLFFARMWRQKQLFMKMREESLRQQLLRGQIDSHFLYNCICGLQKFNRRGDTKGATKYVDQLGNLLLLSLKNARQPFVPLESELKALACYLTLQQELFGIVFDYHIEVAGTIDQHKTLIPPMLLQPFAENAILHGFTGLKEKGQLRITIQKDHNELHCIIEDNGLGLQTVDNQLQKRSLSTIINRERLDILSRQTKTRAQLQIIDKKATTGEAGVRVELVVPYQMGC